MYDLHDVQKNILEIMEFLREEHRRRVALTVEVKALEARIEALEKKLEIESSYVFTNK